jgi:hypothetical protein
MREGEKSLQGLPANVRQNIIKKYASIEDYYFKIFYNRHLHYIAFKAKDSDSVDQLNEELNGMQDELEEFGASDGHAITTEISSDFSENVSKAFTNKVLGVAGVSEDDIRKFIESHLR